MRACECHNKAARQRQSLNGGLARLCEANRTATARTMSAAQFIETVLKGLRRASPRTSRAIFYIAAPDYTYMHSGIRCLHLLCHHLNRLGYRAHVSTQVTNPDLDTPYADDAMLDQSRRAGLIDIVIYPEVVAGNPLNAKRVVRYLLNKPGYFTGVGMETYGSGDFFVHFADEFAPPGKNSLRLRIPLVDQDIYRLPEKTNPRATFAIYSERYRPNTECFPPWITNQEIVSRSAPRTPKALSDLYQKSRALITGERTAACMEAIHCGCPVIMIPHDDFDHKPIVDFYRGYGFCIGFDMDSLSRATTTTHLARRKYRWLVRTLDQSIHAFARGACKHFDVRDAPAYR